MKNPKIILVIVIITTIVGFGAYTLSNNSSNPDYSMQKDGITEQEVVKNENDKALINTTDENVMKPDSMSYLEHSKTALESASGNRRVLFFYASWCPTCKAADLDLMANSSKIPADVRVIRVNYVDPQTDQEEKDIAKKYGITYQHTFVQIDSNGKEVAKWNGGKIAELLSNIK